MVMSTQKEPRDQGGDETSRKRAGHSKVRTGCITCKTRRIKCDEGKPWCLRCLKFGRKCDGYLPSQEEQAKIKHRALYTNLQPKPKSATETKKEGTALALGNKLNEDRRDVTVILQQQPTGVSFENADEYRYFKLFAEKTASRLSGHVDPLLWSQKILQASEREHALRHAVIAIGALDLTSEMRACRNLEGARSANVDSHYLFALRQYSKFVKEMQKVVAKNQFDIRTKLLATLLTFCFEAYLGESDSASAQVHIGVQLIEDWFREQTTSSKRGSRFTSPAPDIIEDEILHAFDRLGIQLIAGTQRFSLEEHIKLKDQGADIVAQIPEVFKDCDEARNHGNFQKRRVMHFMSAASLQVDASVCFTNRLKVISTPTIFLEHERHMVDFQKWSKAFAPVLARSQTPQGEHEFKAAILLQIHHITLVMTVAQMFSDKETDWDLFHSTFVEIINLSKLILKEDDYTFTVNLQCVMPLEFVARKCRDPLLRREALRLLAVKPRREGLKDSMMSAKICAWVIGVEEEGMVDGFVPEEARARNVCASWDFETRIIKIWCNLPAVDGEAGLMRKRRTEIKW